MSRYRCIVAEKALYPVRLLCRVLEVSASGFYAWCHRTPSDRELSNRTLLDLLQTIHLQSRGTYGAPRIQAELRHVHGLLVSRKRIARLLRLAGLAGRHLRRRRGLTKPDTTAVPAPDLVGRDFRVASPQAHSAPGARMVGDITYLATGEGWVYLADVLDLATRSVLGYAMADHMRASLVVDALTMAAGRVALPHDAVFHSDRGSQGEFKWSLQRLDGRWRQWNNERGPSWRRLVGNECDPRVTQEWVGERCASGSGRRSLED